MFGLLIIKLVSAILFTLCPYVTYIIFVDVIHSTAGGAFFVSLLVLTTIGEWISIYLLQNFLTDLIKGKQK